MSKVRTVTIRLFSWPDGASEEAVAEYVDDAVATWGGSLHPEDPLFSSLDVDSVTVGKTVFRRDTPGSR